MASSGRYTHLDGKDHRRVPFGCYKIGLIAAGERDKFLTNEAATDPQVHNHAWVKELGLVSFAGYRLTHTDGTPLGVMVLFSKHPVSTEEDALLEGIAHSTSMVIRTSQIEEDMRKNEEFTRRVIESSSDCIKVLDLQGHLLSMSGGGQKLLEIDDISLYLNSSFIDFWKGKEREGCLEAISKAKRGDTGVFYGYFETAKGTPKWWEVIVTPIKDADGSINRLLAVSRDITERKKAEESIENLNRDLRSTVALLTQSNKQLREFAHIAAHDLKTPLRGIGMLAQWLAQDYRDRFDDHGRRQIGLLVSRVERMDNLIDAVLQYSTLVRNGQNEHQVDLNLLLKVVLDKIQPPQNIKITINKDLPNIICNEEHIIQVFYNLISNAVEFMDKPQGRITIDCTEEDGFWRFSVSDNGPGIAPKHFERIFRLFQILGDHDQFETTGAGLTVAKRIIELYGGRIWLASEAGLGATFFFTLPQQPAAVPQTPQPVAS
jgi:PAS domain S-box-containing protein